MKARAPLLGTVLAAASLIPLSAAPDLMPLDEVRAGMIGVGVSVFQGAQREEFSVHIIGVLHNINGPRRDLILARLDGGPLAETGVIQGMSGSPVYVEGRLIGAISYALGAFPKEAIAGITPIGEMLEAAALSTARPPAPRAQLDLPVSHDQLVSIFRAAFSRVRPFAHHPADIDAVGIPRAAAAQMGTMLRPIATPLVLSGFDQDIVDLLATTLRDLGMVAVLGGAPSGPGAPPLGPLEAGDPIGVSLVSGDLSIAATGTVTLVDEGRVYAFGHRFQNLGPTDFLMTRAHVHTLLPSLFSSARVATIGEPIGVFDQDRATAIAGTLGVEPSLIPITVTLEAADGRRPERSFRFDVVNDQVLTPLLAYVSILNTLRSYERESGAASFTVSGTATLTGHEPIAFEDAFAGPRPSAGAASYVAAPITSLFYNDFEPIQLERLDLRITSREEPRTATVERIWLDDIRLRPGRTVPLKILMRTYRGEEMVRTVPISIPDNALGTLSVLVSGGPQLAQWERQELRGSFAPRSVAQLIRTLNNARRNNRLYVRLFKNDAGAVVEGERLASLPPSMLAVFRADRSRGTVAPLRRATVDEWELASDHVVTGSRLLTFALDAP